MIILPEYSEFAVNCHFNQWNLFEFIHCEKMDTCRASSDAICIIHFDSKDGEIKKLTEGTLAKIIDMRKQWLSLSSSYREFTEVAKRSFKFIDDSDELNITSVEETCGYHPDCYQTFTNISKLDRAKTTIANAGRKRLFEESIEQTDVNPKSGKVARTTRHSISSFHHPCQSSNVLPEICLICKRPGALYITYKVC